MQSNNSGPSVQGSTAPYAATVPSLQYQPAYQPQQQGMHASQSTFQKHWWTASHAIKCACLLLPVQDERKRPRAKVVRSSPRCVQACGRACVILICACELHESSYISRRIPCDEILTLPLYHAGMAQASFQRAVAPAPVQG